MPVTSAPKSICKPLPEPNLPLQLELIEAINFAAVNSWSLIEVKSIASCMVEQDVSFDFLFEGQTLLIRALEKSETNPSYIAVAHYLLDLFLSFEDANLRAPLLWRIHQDTYALKESMRDQRVKALTEITIKLLNSFEEYPILCFSEQRFLAQYGENIFDDKKFGLLQFFITTNHSCFLIFLRKMNRVSNLSQCLNERRDNSGNTWLHDLTRLIFVKMILKKEIPENVITPFATLLVHGARLDIPNFLGELPLDRLGDDMRELVLTRLAVCKSLYGQNLSKNWFQGEMNDFGMRSSCSSRFPIELFFEPKKNDGALFRQTNFLLEVLVEAFKQFTQEELQGIFRVQIKLRVIINLILKRKRLNNEHQITYSMFQDYCRRAFKEFTEHYPFMKDKVSIQKVLLLLNSFAPTLTWINRLIPVPSHTFFKEKVNYSEIKTALKEVALEYHRNYVNFEFNVSHLNKLPRNGNSLKTTNGVVLSYLQRNISLTNLIKEQIIYQPLHVPAKDIPQHLVSELSELRRIDNETINDDLIALDIGRFNSMERKLHKLNENLFKAAAYHRQVIIDSVTAGMFQLGCFALVAFVNTSDSSFNKDEMVENISAILMMLSVISIAFTFGARRNWEISKHNLTLTMSNKLALLEDFLTQLPRGKLISSSINKRIEEIRACAKTLDTYKLNWKEFLSKDQSNEDALWIELEFNRKNRKITHLFSQLRNDIFSIAPFNWSPSIFSKYKDRKLINNAPDNAIPATHSEITRMLPGF